MYIQMINIKISTIIIVIVGMAVSLFLWGRLRRPQLTVRSMAFVNPDVAAVMVGKLALNVPISGDGLYVIGLIQKVRVSFDVKTLPVGVLTVAMLQEKFKRMNEFYDACKEAGVNTLIVLSVGTTHAKPFLEQLRIGVASGTMPEETAVLQKYGMRRFLSLEHGCRQPYILIHDTNTKQTIREVTGSCGGQLSVKVRLP